MNCIKILVIAFLSGCSLMSIGQISDFSYPVIAHSHNDYEQTIPLQKALDNGFGSIEIDIYLYDDKIVVSHDSVDLDKKPSLTDLYLEPLTNQLRGSDDHLYLLVDIKEYVPNILVKLHEAINEYPELFTIRDYKKGNLTIILSGDIPRKEIIKSNVLPYFFIDGRLEHVGKQFDSDLMPLISMNFSHLVLWDGKQDLPKKQKKRLQSIIQEIKAEGKMIRFWKTRDTKLSWQVLIGLGVDMIGVDDLDLFHQTMQSLGLIRN